MPTWNQIQNQLKNSNNPVVFFDIAVGTTEIGRMIFELFADTVPRTVENFRNFCTGEYKKDGVPQGNVEIMRTREVLTSKWCANWSNNILDSNKSILVFLIVA